MNIFSRKHEIFKLYGDLGRVKKSIFTKKWSFFALFSVFEHLQRPVDCLNLEDLLRILEGLSNITRQKISCQPRAQKCTFFNRNIGNENSQLF